MAKKYFITGSSPYRDGCYYHPDIETEWHWSDFFCQHVPNACTKCKYESRLKTVTAERAKGRKVRLEERAKRRQDASDFVSCMKSIYSSYSESAGNVAKSYFGAVTDGDSQDD
jgi:hypothetical protein